MSCIGGSWVFWAAVVAPFAAWLAPVLILGALLRLAARAKPPS